MNEAQKDLLKRYAVPDSLEAQFWRRSLDGTCRALWRRGLLQIVEEQPDRPLIRYEITDEGRQYLASLEGVKPVV